MLFQKSFNGLLPLISEAASGNQALATAVYALPTDL
jgi:hypothetical protein